MSSSRITPWSKGDDGKKDSATAATKPPFLTLRLIVLGPNGHERLEIYRSVSSAVSESTEMRKGRLTSRG